MSAVRYILACLLAWSSLAGARDLAITGARVYDMVAPGPVDNATIVVREGRIDSVSAGGAVPPGMEVVRAAGAVVTPALVNPATQLGLLEVGAAGDTVDWAQGESGLGAAFEVHRAINGNSVLLDQARADGLGQVAIFPGNDGEGPFAGTGAILGVSAPGWGLERAQSAVYAYAGAQGGESEFGSRAAVWAVLRARLAQARGYRERRDPGVELDDYLEQESLLSLRRVLEGQLPLVVVAGRESDIRQAVALARDFDIRVILQGGAEAWRVAPELAAAEIPVILDPLVNLPVTFDALGARSDSAATLTAAGVEVAFSVVGFSIHTTYNAGSSLREAAGWAVRHGLPYMDGLRAITRNPARIWQLEDGAGTLAPGAAADLVIWNGDPLEPASLPRRVYRAGRELGAATRQQLLRDRYLPDGTAPPWRADLAGTPDDE